MAQVQRRRTRQPEALRRGREGKGPCVAVTNVEEIAKSRAQEQSIKSVAAVKLVIFCNRSAWEIRGGKQTFEMARVQQHQQEDIPLRMEAVGLSDDAGQNLKLNQATFFRCVEDDNAHTLQAILRNRKVDVNAYNDEVRRKFLINCVLRACVCLFFLCLC